MRSIYPKFVGEFKCKAAACTDNCCIGWEIGIDDKTLKLYKTQNSPLDKRIRENIKEGEDGAVFKLGRNGRCPFLDECGLCDIIKEKGEVAIPEICREHPRYYNVLSDRVEWGIGLSCEEAARLILNCADIRVEKPGNIDCAPQDGDNALLAFLTDARGEFYKILYDSELPIRERLAALIYYAEVVDTCIENRDFGKIYPVMPLILPKKRDTGWGFGDFSRVLAFLSEMDFMDGNFKKRIEEVADNGGMLPPLTKDSEALILRLVAYFLHRYLITALWDFVTVSKVKFAVVSALVILSLCGESTDEKDFINAAKAYSKEMEYNEDNRELFFDGCFTEKELSSENILTVLI